MTEVEPDAPTEAGPDATEAEPDAEGARVARRRLRAAALATAVAVATLSIVTPWSFWRVTAIPVFYLLLPGLALAQTPLLRWSELDRIPVYIGSAAATLFLGGTAAFLLLLEGAAPLVFTGLPADRLLGWTSLATLAGIAVMGPSSWVEFRLAPGRGTLLRALLPRTGRERLGFAGLSCAAGVGEEIAYRGYALVVLLLVGIPPWLAVVLSSAAFGVLHAYQGVVGVARTAAVGAILAVPVVVTGSLYPSIVAHTLVDLFGGLVLGPRLPLVRPPEGE